jgi:hypothetical protein
MMQNNKRGKNYIFGGISSHPRRRRDVEVLVMMENGTIA